MSPCRRVYHRLLGIGWTYTRGSGLAAYCYMTPKLEGKKSRGTMGVDMFSSEEAVLGYLRQHPDILGAETERLLNLDDDEDPGAAFAAETVPAARKRRAPAKAKAGWSVNPPPPKKKAKAAAPAPSPAAVASAGAAESAPPPPPPPPSGSAAR